jgi:NTE family protein
MRIAVALSGGGFRASLFHLGVLRRIADFGWLSRVDAISGVSGGSIIAAFAALRWDDMLAAGGDGAAFDRVIVDPFVKAITTRSVIGDWLRHAALVAPRRLLDPTFTRTAALGDVLGDLLYGNRLCSDLPESPFIVLNATSLISVRAWRFTRHGLGDSRIGYADWKNDTAMSLGNAVAASAAFPPVFSVARIDPRRYAFGGTVYRDRAVDLPKTIALTDGGVYENLGTEVLTKSTPLPGGKVLQPAEFLLVSDGGYPVKHQFRIRRFPGVASFGVLRRVNTIAMEQVSALRRRILIKRFEDGKQHGVLVTLGSNLDRIPDAGGDNYRALVGVDSCPPNNVVDRIHRVRTHLNRFSREEAEAVMYHGYLLVDAFLWARSAHLPEAYRRPVRLLDRRMAFTPLVVAQTLGALKESHRLW